MLLDRLFGLEKNLTSYPSCDVFISRYLTICRGGIISPASPHEGQTQLHRFVIDGRSYRIWYFVAIFTASSHGPVVSTSVSLNFHSDHPYTDVDGQNHMFPSILISSYNANILVCQFALFIEKHAYTTDLGGHFLVSGWVTSPSSLKSPRNMTLTPISPSPDSCPPLLSKQWLRPVEYTFVAQDGKPLLPNACIKLCLKWIIGTRKKVIIIIQYCTTHVKPEPKPKFGMGMLYCALSLSRLYSLSLYSPISHLLPQLHVS